MPRTPKVPPVTERNTKQEILSAYKSLINEVSDGSPEEILPEDQKILDAAAKETVEKITADLSKFKLSSSGAISSLSDQLTAEAERLVILRKAIAIAQKELEETQKIKVTAGMLLRMVELQKQKEAEFEEEMSAKRASWELEQKDYEEKSKRERGRVEEEYSYARSLEIKRDEDMRSEQERAFTREMAERKDELIKEKKELEDLRKKVAQFPDELDKAIKDAVTEAIIEVRKEDEMVGKLVKQHADSELALAQATIASLEQTIKTQATEIARLNSQVVEASRQVKDIAVAVAEGARKESSIPPKSS